MLRSLGTIIVVSRYDRHFVVGSIGMKTFVTGVPIAVDIDDVNHESVWFVV